MAALTARPRSQRAAPKPGSPKSRPGSAMASSGSTHAPASGHGQVVVERGRHRLHQRAGEGERRHRGQDRTARPRRRGAAAASRPRAGPRRSCRRRRRPRSRPSPCAGSRAAAGRPGPGRGSRPSRRPARARPRSRPPSRGRGGRRGSGRARQRIEKDAQRIARAVLAAPATSARPPSRGSTCQLKRNAATAMSAACGQVRSRRRNAKPPTAMCSSLRLQLARGEGHRLRPEPVDGAAQAFPQRRRPVAQLALGAGAGVRPVLAEHAHHLVGELAAAAR